MAEFQEFLNGGAVLDPRSGVIKSIVVIAHGYGADGQNLIDLGHVWSRKMPDTLFIAPNAFSPCEMGMGYQWFSLADRSVLTLHTQMKAVQKQWHDGLNSVLKAASIEPSQLALVGFSQGAMMSLYNGVYGALYPKGVVGYSGGFAKDPAGALSSSVPDGPTHIPLQEKPKFLLCHGRDDDVVSVISSQTGHQHLQDLGFDSQLEVYDQTGHEINEAGFKAGGAFVKDLLY